MDLSDGLRRLICQLRPLTPCAGRRPLPGKPEITKKSKQVLPKYTPKYSECLKESAIRDSMWCRLDSQQLLPGTCLSCLSCSLVCGASQRGETQLLKKDRPSLNHLSGLCGERIVPPVQLKAKSLTKEEQPFLLWKGNNVSPRSLPAPPFIRVTCRTYLPHPIMCEIHQCHSLKGTKDII